MRSVWVRAIRGRQQGGGAADGRDQELDLGDLGDQEAGAGDEIDARGDHRRGMDQGRDGGRAFHRVGQPDVEGDLGRLRGRRPEQEQRQGELGVVGDGGEVFEVQDVVVAEVAVGEGRPHQEQGDGEAEVADAVDQERFLGRRRRRRLRMPEADQQVGADAHALPEGVGEDEVAGEDQPRHREDEQADHGEEPGVAGVAGHVAGGVDGDEGGHEGDHRQHHGGEAVHPEEDRDVEAGYVDPVVDQRGGGGSGGRQQQGREDERGADAQHDRPVGPPLQLPAEDGRRRRPQEGEQRDEPGDRDQAIHGCGTSRRVGMGAASSGRSGRRARAGRSGQSRRRCHPRVGWAGSCPAGTISG